MFSLWVRDLHIRVYSFPHHFIGGNYGTGRRSGGVSTLVCAVIDENSENTDETMYDFIPSQRDLSLKIVAIDIGHLSESAQVSRSPITSGSVKSHGKSGIPSSRPNSCEHPNWRKKTRAICIWSRKSRCHVHPPCHRHAHQKLAPLL